MGKIITAVAAAALSGLLFANVAYADDPITITLDDADFYAAFKDCALNGPDDEEWTVHANNPTISDANKEAVRNKCWVENRQGIASFDDATQSVTYRSQSDLDRVRHIHLPNYGLKHVEDLKKFPNIDGAKMNNNQIEDIDFDSSSDTVAIFLGNNPLDHIPDYYWQELTSTERAEEIISLLSLTVTDIQLGDSYDGGTYELPELFQQVRAAFAFLQIIADMSDEALQAEYGDSWEYEKAIANFFTIDKWIHVENAYISADYTHLIPIDNTKDIIISFRSTWEELQDSPVLHMCNYMPNVRLICEDGQYTEFGADAIALQYREAYYVQRSNDYASIATITVKRSNMPAPSVSYGAGVHIDDKKLYNALEQCAIVTPARKLYGHYENDHILKGALYCPGLELAVFDSSKQDIIFFNANDLNNINMVLLENMGLEHVDELEKFPNLNFVSVANNEIEHTELFKDDLLDMYSINIDHELVIFNNRLRDLPAFFDIIGKNNLSPYDASVGFADDDERNLAGRTIMSLIMTRAVFVGEQRIEDTYSGDRYEMIDFIAKAQEAFDYIGSFSALDDNATNEEAIATANYYNSDRWLRLENATLGEDRKSLIPIDNTKDMKIAYCEDFSDMATTNPILGGSDVSMVVNLFPHDTEGCVLRATIRHQSNVPPLPATEDNIAKDIAILLASVATLAVSVTAVRRR